ncbi:MAG TPA: L,D-transpeptidase family protein [Gemmatimonadaceae bacterium]|nr:L,D-transpeptidase family protein [Gemmatimonadaceae bacterium]
MNVSPSTPRAAWRRLAALAAVALLATAACDRERATAGASDGALDGAVSETWSPDGLEHVRDVPVNAIEGAIAARLERGARPKGLDDRDWKRVLRLYETYGNRPLWLEEDGDSERADQLIDALAAVHEHGLRSELYPLEELAAALRPIDKARHPSPEQLAQADVMLTSIYVALGEDLLTGQVDPDDVAQEWRIDPQTSDVDSLLARTLRGQPLSRAIERMRPQDEQYDLLRKELKRYRELAAGGGWGQVPAGKSLKPGDRAPAARLAALRERLAAEGYLDGAARETTGEGRDAASAGVYDRELAGAVAAFQARHGIVVDSILGPGTVASMNVPVEHRVGQIMANLERYRWLPRSLGDRYIYVNVPAFRLDAYDDGRRVLSMKVIVGDEYEDRATPAFADSMRYLEFAPYWNVPKEIAEKEIWPTVDADPGYLERNDYEIVEENGETRIRQKPGEKNALGRVKFMFPNPLNIYLHDTPEHALFREDVRAFSHGCIRVEKPAELAAYALAGQREWTRERIEEAMNGENRQVPLARKIPIYIVYFTTFVRDGKLYFGNDIYERDDELVRTVERAALPTPRAVRLLAELRELVD